MQDDKRILIHSAGLKLLFAWILMEMVNQVICLWNAITIDNWIRKESRPHLWNIIWSALPTWCKSDNSDWVRWQHKAAAKTAAQMLFWRNFHHWLHWKLSLWQLSVQPVMKILSKMKTCPFQWRQTGQKQLKVRWTLNYNMKMSVVSSVSNFCNKSQLSCLIFHQTN